MLFTNKKIGGNKLLFLYGKALDRVDCFGFWVWFLIRDYLEKSHRARCGESKKVLNVLRCLAGLTWGANFDALKSIYITLI